MVRLNLRDCTRMAIDESFALSLPSALFLAEVCLSHNIKKYEVFVSCRALPYFQMCNSLFYFQLCIE